MKSFKMMRIALVAAGVIAGVTSCSKDGGDDTAAKKKKLVKLAYNGAEMTFKYDAQGHLTEAIDTYKLNGHDASETSTYVWGENTIDITFTSKSVESGEEKIYQETATLNLENGLAKDISGGLMILGNNKFSYDSSGHLTGFSGFVSDLTLEWNGDKLMSMRDDLIMVGSRSVQTYTYSTDTVTKGYNPLISMEVSTNHLFLAHPELSGIKTGQLPDVRVNEGVLALSPYTWTYYYTYEFDKDGYVTKITATGDIDGEEASPTVYTLVWE